MPHLPHVHHKDVILILHTIPLQPEMLKKSGEKQLKKTQSQYRRNKYSMLLYLRVRAPKILEHYCFFSLLTFTYPPPYYFFSVSLTT